MATYSPAAGPQSASKYQRVGPNYLKYGEQPGWIYDYSIDKYRRDPKVDQELGLAEKPQSGTDQLKMIAGAAGATAVATEGGKALIPGLKEGAGSIYSGARGLLGLGDKAASTAATTTAESALPAALQTSSSGSGAVGTAANGGTMMADGSVVGGESALAGAAPYLGAVGAGLGAKGVYDATQMKDRKKAAFAGGLSGAGMGAGLAAAAPLVGLGPVGWGALGLMALGGGAVGAGLGGVMGRESTDDKSRRRFGSLTTEDAAFNEMLEKGMNESVQDIDTWDRGDDIAGAPIEHMTRSYGVMKAFGPEWAKLDQAKREDVVRKMIAQNLINSKQGDYLVEDEAAAKAILAGA